MINFLASIQNNIRIHNEDCIGNEDCFAEDRMRIISSNAFKRLEAKTQVFPSYHGDHYKKRLTHSLEVAEIAKSITKKLGLNQDLTEVSGSYFRIKNPSATSSCGCGNSFS